MMTQPNFKQLNLMDVFLAQQEVEAPTEDPTQRLTQLEGYERDSMLKSWFGIEDMDTYFYRSTPDIGSPYDLSVHHHHKYLTFEMEAFQSYIGAGLIQCLNQLNPSQRLLLNHENLIHDLGKKMTKLDRFKQNRKKASFDLNKELETISQTLDELDDLLNEIEFELSYPYEDEFMWGELIQFKGMTALIEPSSLSILLDGREGKLKYRLLDISEHPRYSNNLRHQDYMTIGKGEATRASKATRYYGDKQGAGSHITLVEKEQEAINLFINALLKAEKPVFSSSFGKDSIVTLHLGLRACDLLNIPREKVTVFYSDTLNEFNEVRQLARAYEKKEKFRLVVARPEKTLKRIIQDHGGIDESYFSRKGDRRKDENGKSIRPLSEKCCDTLKHDPFYEAVSKYKWDLNAVGTRTEESRQRKQAGLRDGEYLYWNTGEMHKIQPILHWTDEEVFTYIEKYNLPIPTLYRQNLVLDVPKKKRVSDPDLPIDEVYEAFQVVDGIVENPLHALMLKKMGFKVYMPRVGCMLCPTPVKHGYLRWLREFYPKVFKGMLSRLGYAAQLVKMIPEAKKQELAFMLGQPVTTLTILENPELVESILEYMPCAFDQLG